MMLRSVKTAVLNSLLFIRDASVRDIPIIDGNASVWSTGSCVAVSCLPDCDGDTEVTLGGTEAVRQSKAPLFDGLLQTPSRRLIVETVLGETILEASVPEFTSRIRIWTNGLPDTDFVAIAVG
jgi:hypothetical protein